MPKAIEAEINRSVRKAHPGYSAKRVTSETFAVMNKQGFVRGNKETTRGVEAEKEHDRKNRDGYDHIQKLTRKLHGRHS